MLILILVVYEVEPDRLVNVVIALRDNIMDECLV